MSRFRLLLDRRVLFVAVAAALGCALFMTAVSTATAMPSPGVCTYYSNAKYKVVVGQRGTGCCGEPISWGETSAYRKCDIMYCLDVLCPNDPSEI